MKNTGEKLKPMLEDRTQMHLKSKVKVKEKVKEREKERKGTIHHKQRLEDQQNCLL